MITAALTADDSDLTQLHRTRLDAFAKAHDTRMLARLDAAWQAFGATPFQLWASIEARFPGQTQSFVADLRTLHHEREASREAAARNVPLPPYEAVNVTILSTYTRPPLQLLAPDGTLAGPAPPEAIPEGFTPGAAPQPAAPAAGPGMRLVSLSNMPPVQPLGGALESLLAVSPRQLTELTYLRKAAEPLVLVYGVLCVLLDQLPTWNNALSIIADPQLVDKCLFLSNLSVTDARPLTPSSVMPFAPGRPRNRLASHAASAANTAAIPSPRALFPELRVTSKQVSLARKLLNRHPDCRAQVACMSLRVEPQPGSNGPVLLAPCIALQRLVEWECAFVLHMTEVQKAAEEAQKAAAAAAAAAQDGGGYEKAAHAHKMGPL